MMMMMVLKMHVAVLLFKQVLQDYLAVLAFP